MTHSYRTFVRSRVSTKPGQGHYNRFRYYDPGIGRYVSADPIGQVGDLNLYRYAINDPTGDFDPLGLNNFGGPIFQSTDPNGPLFKPGPSASDECFTKCIATAVANLANPVPVDIPFEGLSGGNDGGVGGAEAAEGAAQAGDRVTRLSKNDQRDLDRANDLLSRRSTSSRSPDTNQKIADRASKLEGAKKLAKRLGTAGDIIALLDFGSEVAKCREQCKDPNCPTKP